MERKYGVVDRGLLSGKADVGQWSGERGAGKCAGGGEKGNRVTVLGGGRLQ